MADPRSDLPADDADRDDVHLEQPRPHALLIHRGFDACLMNDPSLFFAVGPNGQHYTQTAGQEQMGPYMLSGVQPSVQSYQTMYQHTEVNLLSTQMTRIQIPQRPYSAPKQFPRPGLPRDVYFTRHGERGIPFALALSGRLDGLDEADERSTYESFGQKVTYRIEWPGYSSFSYAKHVRKKQGECVITRAEIVQQVAAVTREFFTRCAAHVCTNPGWAIGSNSIKLDHLVLVGVSVVSIGSAQPIYEYCVSLT